MRFASAAVAGCCAALLALPAAGQNVPNLVDHDALHVCADPGFLPFSDEQGQGFENHVASIVAKALDVPVEYTWYPESSGFLRNTLLAHKCDVVMSLPSGGGEAETTPAYYRTGYMIVTRAADPVAATTLADPSVAALRFGVVAGTPPADLLVAHDLIGQAKVYPLVVDTRHDSPALTMMHDVADGRIDAGLVWGPFAGWAIAHEHLKLRAAFLQSEPGHPRMDYAIAMGVRPNEDQWANRLAKVIWSHQADIKATLVSAGVPLLDTQNRPVFVPSPSP